VKVVCPLLGNCINNNIVVTDSLFLNTSSVVIGDVLVSSNATLQSNSDLIIFGNLESSGDVIFGGASVTVDGSLDIVSGNLILLGTILNISGCANLTGARLVLNLRDGVNAGDNIKVLTSSNDSCIIEAREVKILGYLGNSDCTVTGKQYVSSNELIVSTALDCANNGPQGLSTWGIVLLILAVVVLGIVLVVSIRCKTAHQIIYPFRENHKRLQTLQKQHTMFEEVEGV